MKKTGQLVRRENVGATMVPPKFRFELGTSDKLKTGVIEAPKGKSIGQRTVNFAVGTAVISGLYAMGQSLYHSPKVAAAMNSLIAPASNQLSNVNELSGGQLFNHLFQAKTLFYAWIISPALESWIVAGYLAPLLTNVVNWLSSIDFGSAGERITQLLEVVNGSPLISSLVIALVLCTLLYYSTSSVDARHDDSPLPYLQTCVKTKEIRSIEGVEHEFAVEIALSTKDDIQAFTDYLNAEDKQEQAIITKKARLEAIETIDLEFNDFDSSAGDALVALFKAPGMQNLAKAKFNIKLPSDAGVIERFTQFLEKHEKSCFGIHGIMISNDTLEVQADETRKNLEALLKRLPKGSVPFLKSLSFQNLQFPLDLNETHIPQTVTELYFGNSVVTDINNKGHIKLTNIKADRICFDPIPKDSTIDLVGCTVGELAFGDLTTNLITLKETAINKTLSFGSTGKDSKIELVKVNYENITNFSRGKNANRTFFDFEQSIRYAQFTKLNQIFKELDSKKLDKTGKKASGDIVNQFYALAIDILRSITKEQCTRSTTDSFLGVLRNVPDHPELINDLKIDELNELLELLLTCNDEIIKFQTDALHNIISIFANSKNHDSKTLEIVVDYCILIIKNEDEYRYKNYDASLKKSIDYINRFKTDSPNMPQGLRDKIIAIKEHKNFKKPDTTLLASTEKHDYLHDQTFDPRNLEKWIAS